MAPKLARLIALWTCKVCNGEGCVATATAKVWPDGLIERTTVVRACAPCDGSGIEADAATRLGLFD